MEFGLMRLRMFVVRAAAREFGSVWGPFKMKSPKTPPITGCHLLA